METKICSRPSCSFEGKPQSIKNFCKDKHLKDGKHPYCRTCRTEIQRKRMQTSEESRQKAKAAHRRYVTSEHGKKHYQEYYQAHKSEYRARERKYQSRPDVLARKARKQVDYRTRNKHKEAARRCVNYAIQCGEVMRPAVCEWCGKQSNGEVLQAHHWMGYEFEHWFNVKFVHDKCHSQCESASAEDWASRIFT